MHSPSGQILPRFTLARPTPPLALAILISSLASTANAAVAIQGQVVDANGNPLAQVQVSFDRVEPAQGASVVTVFTDAEGHFSFPGAFNDAGDLGALITARALGYEQRDRLPGAQDADSLELTFVMQAVANQVNVAPASAWLTQRITDRAQQSKFVMDCIDCHQVPASEVRAYAASIADVHAADPAAARTESWNSLVKYMNYLSAWEFSRGRRAEGEQLDADAVYSVGDAGAIVPMLANAFTDRLDHIEGFDWGAPLIATADTAIWEYEVPEPNAIREAIMTGTPAKLWLADVAANRMVSVDVATGAQETHEVPSEVLMSPHSMHRGDDGSLWITPLFNSIVAHLQPDSGEWKTWKLQTNDGKNPGIHDLSFGWEHTLLTDARGRIWFSDIGNTSVGYFDPGEGNSQIWPAPQLPERGGPAALYGLAMTSDHNEVWYSQLNNGVFGGFDIEKQEYIGPFMLPDPNAGPRRLTIDDNDVLYLALYGSGQLAEFDTKTREMVGIYDLPDTASAPYTATWDQVRKVVWIGTSNGDVIYRFDPATKEFGVLPLPRERAFLRMIDIDPKTGVLVTSYANIVDIVNGPRMALIIDPGDNAYPEKFTAAHGVAPANVAALP
jgi:streptogramin lyase